MFCRRTVIPGSSQVVLPYHSYSSRFGGSVTYTPAHKKSASWMMITRDVIERHLRESFNRVNVSGVQQTIRNWTMKWNVLEFSLARQSNVARVGILISLVESVLEKKLALVYIDAVFIRSKRCCLVLWRNVNIKHKHYTFGVAFVTIVCVHVVYSFWSLILLLWSQECRLSEN